MELKKCSNDSAKAMLLCRLGSVSSGSASLGYLKEALRISEKCGYPRGLAQSNYLLGRYFYFKENFSPSLRHCGTALRYAEALPDYRLAARCCLFIGFNHYHNAPRSSLDYYQQCIRYAKGAGDSVLLSYAYSAIGSVYEKWEDGKNALGYFILSLKIRERKGSADEHVSSLIETARAFSRNNLYDKCDRLIEKALLMAEQNGQNEQNLVYLYQMRGYHFFDREKNYKKALDYFLRSYKLVEKNEWYDKNNIEAIRPLAETYFRLGDKANAAAFYNLYLKKSEEVKKKIDKELLDAQSMLLQETEKQKTLIKDSEILKQRIVLEKTEKQIYLYVFVSLILGGLAFLFYRNARVKEQALLTLDSRVKERTAQLLSANEQLQVEISEKTSAQQKLSDSEARLTEANRELEAFIYKASHDLKGPLSSSRGLVNLALNEEHADEREQFIKLIGQSLERLEAILQELQELALIRQGKVVMSKIDAENTIRSLLPNFSGYDHYSNIEFLIVNQFTKDFFCDKILFHSVLRNVLENAVKYSKKNSHSFVKIELYGEGGWLVIKVTDNGIGISPEFHEKIFDVFFRANDSTKGSGLGLYIVKSAMKKLKGKVELNSSVLKEGTVISLYFPVVDP